MNEFKQTKTSAKLKKETKREVETLNTGVAERNVYQVKLKLNKQVIIRFFLKSTVYGNNFIETS